MNHNFKRAAALGSALTLVAGLAGCQTGTPPTPTDSSPAPAPVPPVATQDSSTTAKPNVVYIVLDDMGFGDLGCYGSSINTPNIDLLASQGIRYTSYYTNPMSSPSRASLLTGCEANLVGMGATSDIDLGDAVPNIHGRIYPEHGTLADTLRENGYQTISTGKWHLGPYDEFSPDGDKTHWPSGKGFDKTIPLLEAKSTNLSPAVSLRAIVSSYRTPVTPTTT